MDYEELRSLGFRELSQQGSPEFPPCQPLDDGPGMVKDYIDESGVYQAQIVVANNEDGKPVVSVHSYDPRPNQPDQAVYLEVGNGWNARVLAGTIARLLVTPPF